LFGWSFVTAIGSQGREELELLQPPDLYILPRSPNKVLTRLSFIAVIYDKWGPPPFDHAA